MVIALVLCASFQTAMAVVGTVAVIFLQGGNGSTQGKVHGGRRGHVGAERGIWS